MCGVPQVGVLADLSCGQRWQHRSRSTATCGTLYKPLHRTWFCSRRGPTLPSVAGEHARWLNRVERHKFSVDCLETEPATQPAGLPPAAFACGSIQGAVGCVVGGIATISPRVTGGADEPITTSPSIVSVTATMPAVRIMASPGGVCCVVGGSFRRQPTKASTHASAADSPAHARRRGGCSCVMI